MKPFSRIILLFSILYATHFNLYAQQEEGELLFARKAIKDGFFDIAENKLQSFLKKYPNSLHKFEAYLLLGKCFYNTGDYKKALYEFQLIIDNPEASELEDEAYYWTGEVYFKSGNFNEAIRFYQIIIDDHKDSSYLAFAYYSLAWSYYELNDYNKAVEVFQKVASDFPLDRLAVKAEYKICEIFYEREEFAKARLSLH